VSWALYSPFFPPPPLLFPFSFSCPHGHQLIERGKGESGLVYEMAASDVGSGVPPFFFFFLSPCCSPPGRPRFWIGGLGFIN